MSEKKKRSPLAEWLSQKRRDVLTMTPMHKASTTTLSQMAKTNYKCYNCTLGRHHINKPTPVIIADSGKRSVSEDPSIVDHNVCNKNISISYQQHFSGCISLLCLKCSCKKTKKNA
jgi:hypothetical protein